MKLRYHFYFLWRAENSVTEGGRGEGGEERGKREEEEEGSEERKEEGERFRTRKLRRSIQRNRGRGKGRRRAEKRTEIRKRGNWNNERLGLKHRGRKPEEGTKVWTAAEVDEKG